MARDDLLWDSGVRHISRWIFNAYLVDDGGSERPFVVDAGLRSIAERIVDALRARGTAPDRIAALVSTHGHVDHVGGIPWLREASGAAVYLPRKVRDYLEKGEIPRHPGLFDMMRMSPVFLDQRFEGGALLDVLGTSSSVGFAMGRFAFPGPKPEGYLADGERVPGAPAWEVLETAGHTDDSVCFYHRASRTLLSGDAVLTHGGRAWFNPELVDLGRSRETEERLRALQVDFLLPGHGLPLRGKDLLRDARSCRS